MSRLAPTILLLALAAASVAPRFSRAQAAPAAELPVDPVTQRITFSAVVPVPGATQAQLYARAVAWATNEASTAGPDFSINDLAQGTVLLRGAVRSYALSSPVNSRVLYALTIYVKPERYKYVLTNLRHEGVAEGTTTGETQGPLEQKEVRGFAKGFWRKYKQDIGALIQESLAQLQTAMTTDRKDPSDF